MPNLSIIVLAYNDAPALPGLTADLHTALQSLADRFEIIIVNDGSHDNTSEIAETCAQSHTNIRVLQHECNQGVGAAFQTGLEAAQYDITGYIDGDAQYKPDDFETLLKYLPQGGAISGIRQTRADPFHRLFISRIYRHLIHRLFGLRLNDVNCGIKLYHRTFFQPENLFSTGPFYDAEILIKGHHAEYPIEETPVQHLRRRHGKSGGASFKSIRRTLSDLTSPTMRSYIRPGILTRILYIGLCLLNTLSNHSCAPT